MIEEKDIPYIAEQVQRMYDGLKAQGFKQSLGETGCSYRGADGLKCAIGHVIADEDYNPEMEKKGIASYAIFCKTPFKKFFDLESDFRKALDEEDTVATFLYKLQSVHDVNHIPDQMQERFIKTCKKYNISIKE